ncbi:MAG TPA: SCO family protein [Burkholderiales bacterium]|nr:SCO family protein [Burkholderiales bacterium]
MIASVSSRLRAALCAGAAAAMLFPGAARSGVSALPALQPSPGQRAAAPSPPALDPGLALTLSQRALGVQVGEHVLHDTQGRAVPLSSFRGKPLLISFVYTGCFTVCPTTTRTLKRAVESAVGTLGSDSFNVVSIGFNLPFDTPQALQAFAHQQGVTLPNWHFLSPDPATLQALTHELGFSYAPLAGGFDHITQVSVVDQSGRVYRQVYGERFPLPQLVGPLKELITGAPPAEQSLAGLLERVRLLCTYYDADTGRYRYRYSLLLEITGGLLGISTMAAFLLYELRKTRRAAGP